LPIFGNQQLRKLKLLYSKNLTTKFENRYCHNSSQLELKLFYQD
jgi:hypothetical protein